MFVIFDCDGVLVDSEALAAHVFSDVLARNGFDLSPSACHRQFQGWTLEACFVWLEARFERALPSDFKQQLDLATEQRFSRELSAMPGVEDLLKDLSSRAIGYCVASNGGHAKVRNSLATTGLATWFDDAARFSAEDVAQGKPDPALFLMAADHHGVPASFCWVIEDSLAGAQAARAAGMHLLFFSPDGDAPDEVQALAPDAICHSMREVRDVLSGPH